MTALFLIERIVMDNEYKWELSRKAFVKSLLISGAALQLPWLTSCSHKEELKNVEPLSKEQFNILAAIQEVLFPSDGNGPGASKLNAGLYVVWILNDSEQDPDENNFIIEKLDQFEEFSKEETGTSFLELNSDEQHQLVKKASNIKWGRTWLSRLLTLIFEALLLDPQYGSNPDGIGWKWLNHNPGSPRPTKNLLYPEILNRSHEV